ncbi:hypothetical protein L227DRAFT_598824 [Lentinus tigrinus ALCF2SS1-6]|uniref:Uncharacterized protein n=1 Tax=Lentinus tigrinus ALCF2SS1-6 TaxID=1328759 RepID=A0A5C2SKQ4_9APHY|nr:hypothetical protein L227DRAFT_598824 [Lentinus tigrinus ALCF2SS1-6]
MTTLDPFDSVAPIAGSRRPILVPAFSSESSTSSHAPTPSSTIISHTVHTTLPHSRRKPVNVFKSPTADEPGVWEAHNSTSRKHGIAPYTRLPPRRASSSTDSAQSSVRSSVSATVAIRPTPPLLPLYHPFGPLAQSLPRLRPSVFGLPDSLNIDDPDDQPEGDVTQTGSRVRRAAPKARDAAEDDMQSPGTPNGSTPDASSKERNPSPRKRRGGGAKRKRKDADDGDSVFPPPPKRTRNPRGAAANNSVPAAPSPLVGPAVVASDLVEETPENNGEVEEEAQEEPPAPKRSSRARKPRTRPAKRRDSSGSASTGTSVSVSIAAAAKAAAEAKVVARAPPEDEAQTHGDGVNGVVDGMERREEEEPEDAVPPAPPPIKEASPPEAPQPAPSVDSATPSAVQVVTEPQDVPMQSASPALVQSPSPIPTPIAAAARPSAPPQPPAATTPRPTPASAPALSKEEREEGELSDD